MSERYRWVILATGAVGAGAFSALRMGLPSLGPAVRGEFGLTLGEVRLAFAAVTGLVLAPLEGDEDARIAARAPRARELPEPLPLEAM